MRAGVLAALLVSGLAGAAAAAPSARELDRALGGIERTASAEEIRALGPDTDVALIKYAESASTSPLRRRRAIVALGYVPSVTAKAWLLDLVAARRTATDDQGQHELAAATGALVPYGAEVLPVLMPLLAHDSPDVRRSAAAALARLGLPEAEGPLRARLAVERDSGVRYWLGRALEALHR